VHEQSCMLHGILGAWGIPTGESLRRDPVKRPMQVEMIQIFGASMSHTPWYRFAFFDFIKTYFEVLSKETNIVASRNGWFTAVASTAFLTDLVPGIVMSILFAQMTAIAYPLRKFVGESYDESRLIEELLIAAPRRIDWSTSVDKRIVLRSELANGLVVLSVPTFKPFTEVMLTIAEKVPSATVLQISGQSVIQVRVEVVDGSISATREVIENVKTLTGCELLFQFKYPTSGIADREARVQLALAVQTVSLLSTIRYCQDRANGIDIVQLYDFFE